MSDVAAPVDGSAHASTAEASTGRSSSILGAGAAYTILGALQSLVGLVLLPFFTAWLDPAEFGQIGVLLAISAFAMYVLPLGLEAIVLRGWFRAGSSDQRRLAYASEIETVLVIVPFGLAPILTLILAATGISQAVPTPYVLATLLAAACFVAATIVPYSVLRAERRVRPYMTLAGSYVAVQIIGRVVLVGVLNVGVTGWVIADFTSSAYLLAVAPRVAGVSVRLRRWSERARADLRRSLPLVPHGLGSWGLSVSDRLVLAPIVPLAALGVYSLGYQVCTILIMLFSELNRAVAPDYAAVDLEADPQCASLRPLVSFQTAVVITLATIAAVVGPQAILLFLPSSYAEASTVVPWVVLGAGFVGLYQIPMNHITFVRGNTQRAWFAAVTAAVTNIALNIVLVPIHGITAAAINTAVAYFVFFVLLRVYERISTGTTLLPEWRSMARYTAVSLPFLVGVVAAGWLPSSLVALGLALGCGVLAAGGVVAMFWRTTRSPKQEVAV